MRILIVGLVMLGSVVAAAGPVYKWVDEKGVTHYSDQPHPGAKEIHMEAVQTYSAPPVPKTAASTPASAQASATLAASYSQLEIQQPRNDESFSNTAGVVTVGVRLEPGLQADHAIWIYLDGKRVDGLPRTGGSFQLSEVSRGTHTVVASVTDGSGKQLIASAPVTFHVHQVSLLSPGRRR